MKKSIILVFLLIFVGWSDDLPKEITGKDGAEMALIPAGDFEMGTSMSDMPQLVEWSKKWFPAADATWFERETPQHTVYLDAFYMDKYEVTNALYKKFVDAIGYKAPALWENSKYNAPNHPVVGVTWEDATAYAEWAGKRLPTEAEWEKAARGGLIGKEYPWGDEAPDGTQCNFSDKSANYSQSDMSVDDGYKFAAPVGSYKPNGYGLHDMVGNVWEWCADWYDDKYYAKSPKENPKGPDLGTQRVTRGGEWKSNPITIRVALRHKVTPTKLFNNQGFRCVLQE